MIDYQEEGLSMFSNQVKVKIAKDLYERLARVAQAGGYADVNEFIVHILDRESAQFDDAADEAEVEKQLRGLGYIE